MMPISCMECRRRKIKCNKLTPCNQCTVKDRICEYPSKFRSIEIEQLVIDSKKISNSSLGINPGANSNLNLDSKSLPISLENSRNPSLNDTISFKKQKLDKSISPPVSENSSIQNNSDSIESINLTDIIKENETLKLKIRDLKLKTKRQRTKLKKHSNFEDDDDDDDDEFEEDDCDEGMNDRENVDSKHNEDNNAVTTNENEMGSDKPNNNTDSTTKSKNNTTNNSASAQKIGRNLINSRSPPIYYGPNSTMFMVNSSSFTKNDFLEFDNFIKVRRQISRKRDLPVLVEPKTSSTKSKILAAKENIDVLIKLVKKFMHIKVHYYNYLSINSLVEFLENFDDSKSWKKEDDEKLLLIIMIIIVTLRSIPSKDIVLTTYNLSYKKNRHLLYKQYKNLKDGIKIQTTTTLRAYVLECEDLFYNDRIEQSWALLFQCVSFAYALGLHVYDQTIVETLKSEEHDKSGDIIRKNPKTSLWFVINFISATLCSVLGRPNPVTFNFQPLLKNYEIRLNYKIALTDLIKRSTNILIDSYKVQIDYNVVMDIDQAFVNEALIYEKILIDTRIMKNLESRDTTRASFITLPVYEKPVNQNSSHNKMKLIEKRSKSFKSLSELNLPRLLNECPLDIRFTILRPCPLRHEEENFCMILEDSDTLCDLILLYGNRAKFNQHFMSQYKTALESCMDSCQKVLDHSLDLIELLYRKTGEPNFQAIHPFFYVFLYQTFVVIYTILHLRFSILAPYSTEIESIRNKLFKLFDAVGSKNWKPNVIRMIQYINEMCDNFFNTRIEKDSADSNVPFSLHSNNTSGSIPATPKTADNNFFNSSQNTPKFLIDNKSSTFISMLNANQLPVYSIPENISKQISEERDNHGELDKINKDIKTAGNSSNNNNTSNTNHTSNTNNNANNTNSKANNTNNKANNTNNNATKDGDNNNNNSNNSNTLVNGNSFSNLDTLHSAVLFGQNESLNSLSQVSLLDYYNTHQQFYPPAQHRFLDVNKSEINGNSDSIIHNIPDDVNFTQIGNNNISVDPLLGFDLNDPFFIQNPFNFNSLGQGNNDRGGSSVNESIDDNADVND